jgi:Protein of unknown function (DUF2924)
MPMTSKKPRNRTIQRRLGGEEALAREIAELSDLDAQALRQQWVTLLGGDPPLTLGRSTLIHAIAYRLQERVLGGLKPSTLRILNRVAGETTSADDKRAPALKTGAGTVLIREWRGVTHRVTVLDEEVVYRGRRYKSLSEVARLITGTHWSGPLFFGLRNRSKEKAHG